MLGVYAISFMPAELSVHRLFFLARAANYRFKHFAMPKIGTHDGKFHCDEVIIYSKTFLLGKKLYNYSILSAYYLKQSHK